MLSYHIQTKQEVEVTVYIMLRSVNEYVVKHLTKKIAVAIDMMRKKLQRNIDNYKGVLGR